MVLSIMMPADGVNGLVVALEALIAIDRAYLDHHKNTPWLYESGVRYRRESPGMEEWLSVPLILERGNGDCEDLAAWRVAELRNAGEYNARCAISKTGRTWHIYVKRGNGAYEDPSKRLGMR